MALLLLGSAVYSQPPNGEEFFNPKIDHFWIAIDYNQELVPGLNGAVPVDDPGETGQWLQYAQAPQFPWFNTWFYNAPFDDNRMKKIRMGFWVHPLVPGMPGTLFYVINWSTPDWTPVIPGFPTPDDEAYIMRSMTNGPIVIDPNIPPPGIWLELYYEIPDYNPEWVSVDVFGQNLIISQDPTPPPVESPLYFWWVQNPGPGGIIVHECLATEDYGDAPEEDTAYIRPVIIGHFPTCTQVGPPNSYISHGCPSALFFGAFVDCENDGNAGYCPTFGPNWFNMDECGTFPYPIPPTAPPLGPVDEGLIKPIPLTLGLLQPSWWGYFPCGAQGQQPLGLPCQVAVWGQNIDIWLNGINPQIAGSGYFNVLFDWNCDGDWLDVVNCNNAPLPEHVIVDFFIPPGFVGPISALAPPNFTIGPQHGYAWARFSLTESPVGPGWDATGEFNDGETEDYLILIGSPPVIPIANWAIFMAACMIVMLVASMWWRNR